MVCYTREKNSVSEKSVSSDVKETLETLSNYIQLGPPDSL